MASNPADTNSAPQVEFAEALNSHSNGNSNADLRPSTDLGTSTPDSWGSSPSEEDYDENNADTTAVVESDEAGLLKSGSAADNAAEGWRGHRQHASASKFEHLKADDQSAEKAQRRRSVQVILERADKKGKYFLTADDPELREILRHGIAKEEMDSKRQKQTRLRDLVFTKQFTTFDRQNPSASESPFHGFFTLFWLAMGLMLFRVAAWNWREHGSVFGGAELLHYMFDRDVIVMGLSDGVLTLATGFTFGLQHLVARGIIKWNTSGWIIQNLWQTFYLGGAIGWTFYRQWPWTHTIFIVLHTFVFLMKQHSFAFYNGYLSQVRRRTLLLESKLKQLENMEAVASPKSPTSPSWSSKALDHSHKTELKKRRPSVGPRTSTSLGKEGSEISDIAKAIESGAALSPEQLTTFKDIIKDEIQYLNVELCGKNKSGWNKYPKNLNVANYADYTVLPTLVYELEYPRQETRNWWYVAEKTAATFGCIWIMMVISQAYIYPAVRKTVDMREAGMSLDERWAEFPFVVLDMLFPLLLEQLMTWYVIWECILNVLAELTKFADRGFYGDWWNSVSWDQYARDWNRPVHNFLLRHVYHSSISAFHLSKLTATFVTFFLSACVHELVMFCLFKKVRGYLFMMQLSQIPLAMLSRTRLLKGRALVGNLIFWTGLFIGPAFLTSLYLIV